jgi:acetyl esterase
LPVIMQFLIYPGTHTGSNYPSRKMMMTGFGLTPTDMRYYDQAYASDPAHWRSSPLLADQTGMPLTLLVTASLDPLRDEGRAYAAKAIAAGVQTTYREMKGTIHGFASYRAAIPSARTDLTAILNVAREMLSEAS